MNVRELRSGEEAAFDSYVRHHGQGSPFHLTIWRDLVRGFAGFHPRYLLAEENGRMVGVLPLFAIRSPLLGRALVSVPYGVYGGVLAHGERTAAVLVDAARHATDEIRAGYLELRQMHPLPSDLVRSDLYLTFLRDLPEDDEECLKMIPRKSRASARIARDRHGMKFVEGKHLLDDFYELFVHNKRSLGSPVFSRAWFERILSGFGDDVLVHGVCHQGKVVAAVISFAFGETIMPYYSGSESGAERLGCMNFMYWNLMRAAVRRGLKRYDFGRSRAATGAASFKKNMGFQATPLAYQYYLREGRQIPSVSPSNPKFDLVQRIWRRLPVRLVKMLGPRLMRYLP